VNEDQIARADVAGLGADAKLRLAFENDDNLVAGGPV